MMSYWTARRRWPLWAAAGAVLTVVAVLFAARLAGAAMPYNPTFEMTGISSTVPSANADITFRTTLPAGNDLAGTYGLEIPDNSWNVAAHSSQLNGKIAAVGTMTITLGPTANCTAGSPHTYGPFPLLDVDPGTGGPYAMWRGTITDFADGNPNTNWGLTLNIDPVGTSGFTIDGFLTDAILPAGNTVCTPEVFTLKMCGRANPIATATVCGSGSDPIVMTNPVAAGCYAWRLVTVSDSGLSSATRDAGVSIGGTPCLPDGDGDGVPDSTDNCPRWPNSSQNLPPWPVPTNDPDCDGFSTALETSAGTNSILHCGASAWPADLNNDGISDITDVSALTANFGFSVPPAPARYNIAPDPVDGFIDVTDISKMTSFFGFSC